MTETATRDEVLFRGNWTPFHWGSAAGTLVLTVQFVATREASLAVVAVLLWWWTVRRCILRATLTRNALVLETATRERRIAIDDIVHVGHWYGTIWERGKFIPWDVP